MCSTSVVSFHSVDNTENAPYGVKTGRKESPYLCDRACISRGACGTRPACGPAGLVARFFVKQPLWKLTKRKCKNVPVGGEMGLVKHVNENKEENER